MTNKTGTRNVIQKQKQLEMDLRVKLTESEKIPCLESRAPKLWTKVDRMYKYKQKGNQHGN